MRSAEEVSAHQRGLKLAHKYYDDILGAKVVTDACRYRPHRELTKKQRERVLAEVAAELGLEEIDEQPEH